METQALIAKHAPHVALQFSGGRDSLAMLLLLKDQLAQMTVYYVNSGDGYPETLALIAAVKRWVPRFVEVQGRVADTHARLGWPSDLLQPGAAWAFGRQSIKGHLQLVDRHTCCYESLMAPMQRRMQADGVTLILRGQRDDDSPKSPVKHGEVVDGVTVAYPLGAWTSEQVDAFIATQGVPLPPYYAAGVTSAPDCMHCTAWLEHKALPYLAAHHPTEAKTVSARLSQIRVAVEPYVKQLLAAQESLHGMV